MKPECINNFKNPSSLINGTKLGFIPMLSLISCLAMTFALSSFTQANEEKSVPQWTLKKLEGVYKMSSPSYPATLLSSITKEGKVRHFEKYDDNTVASCLGEAVIKDNIVHIDI